MKYLSVCSGIEAATVAWHPLGWGAVAYSEIEPFPCALLAHYYPETPNWGDMTRFQEWPNAAPDVLVGGTPCQAFSVAGLRAGLADPRGNLTLTYLAVAARYRPRWVVWENVPGVLSDRTGAFGSLLGGLAKLGYGWAYRTLDAQFFRLAQQRRRVFVVGCLGGWPAAGAVLFERESLSGNPAPRREAGKGFAHDVAPCIDRSGTGFSRTGDIRGQDPVIAHTLRAEGFDASEDGTGRGIPLISMCLNAGAMGMVDAETETMIPVAFGWNKSASQTMRVGEFTDALQASATSNPAIAFALRGREGGAVPEVTGDMVSAIRGSSGGSSRDYVASQLRVRRLTPRECERLQGFPDDYTLVQYRNGPAKDGPRYKALGNSMAVPVMRWIGERIALVDAIAAEARAA